MSDSKQLTERRMGERGRNEELIKHMVKRFLVWRLPENFNPDAGISFKAEYTVAGYPMKHEPVGTNLLDAQQAEAMVRYMLDGLPMPQSSRTAAPVSADEADIHEAIARIMHATWTKTKRAQGFHGPDDPCQYCDRDRPVAHCTLWHADLIPWEQLPEKQKDINRHAFDAVLESGLLVPAAAPVPGEGANRGSLAYDPAWNECEHQHPRYSCVVCNRKSPAPVSAGEGAREWRERSQTRRLGAPIEHDFGFWTDSEVDAYAASLRAERDELKRQLANFRKLAEERFAEIERARKIIAGLVERAESAERRVEELRRYAQHDASCVADLGKTCDCGLAALRKALEEVKKG